MPGGVHRRRQTNGTLPPSHFGVCGFAFPAACGLTMAQPRRLSRPDRPTKDSHRRTDHVRCMAQQCAGATTHGYESDGLRFDPGRLIETAFRTRHPADDPETYLLAWLAVLSKQADAPHAARMLAGQLRRLAPCAPSPWQQRLIELLDFVAAHRPRLQRETPVHPSQKSAPAKGKS